MRILLDDQPCDVDAEYLGDAIAACATLAEERGRYIVEVVVDGTRWSNDQLGSANLAGQRADELRLTTAEPAELVGQTFAQAATALGEAREIQNDAAALIQRDDIPGGMQRLNDAFSIWISVQQAVVQGSQLVGLDLDTCTVNDRSAPEVILSLNERLEALRTQLENGDSLGVADTLLYDLPEVIDEWRDLLEHLQQCVEEA